MIYIKDTLDFKIEEETAITFGKFDGIHKGHELLLEKLSNEKEKGLKIVVFTFNIPPKTEVYGDENKVITTNEERALILEEHGVDYIVECPFTKEIMTMEPEAFVKMISERLNVRSMVVGTDFRFAHNRSGNPEILKSLSSKYDFKIQVIDKIREDDKDISSTFVRDEIKLGDIKKANSLLGYNYFVKGRILHGNQIGRTIGIPTINQIPESNKLLPPFGVYRTLVSIDDKVYRGVTNVGVKPTIEGLNPVGVETHLLDFKGDVYEQIATVEFLEKVRDERKFESIEDLKKQMQNDIAFCRNEFSIE